MSHVAPATCSEIPSGSRSADTLAERCPQLLAKYRQEKAYVLLGDPGSGKTTAFTEEARKCGGHVVSARNLIALDPGHHPEWAEGTLFIDGLDEARSIGGRPALVLDKLRGRLAQLSPERWRIACRTSDWLFPSDRKHLNDVLPTGEVKVLHLEPLSEEDIRRVLRASPEVPDVDSLLKRLRNQGLIDLLRNPQLLDFFVRVLPQGDSARSRTEIFGKACRSIASEANMEHRTATNATGSPPPIDELLEIAGRLFALQLLTGSTGFTLSDEAITDSYLRPWIGEAYPLASVQAALKTRLFRAGDSGRTDSRVPVHQGVAEFLAARSLSRAIASKLPARRVLALLAGDSPRVPSANRGLAGWLASFSPRVRQTLILKDPVCLLHGTLDGYTPCEKNSLLCGLKSHAPALLRESGQIRYAAAASLGTPEMDPHLQSILHHQGRSDQDQALSYLVLHVLEQGSRIDRWSSVLSEVVRDQTRWPESRILAFHLLTESHLQLGEEEALHAWLNDLAQGQVPDEDGLLLGSLLTLLYPRHLGPDRIWDYLARARPTDRGCEEFWSWRFGSSTRGEDLPILLDRLSTGASGLQSMIEAWILVDVVLDLLARGVEEHGANVPVRRLYDWLSAGAGVSLGWNEGQDASKRIRSWLEERQETLKAVVREGLLRPGASDDNYLSHADHVRRSLFGARLPPRFGHWCLGQINDGSVAGQPAEILFGRSLVAIRSGEGNEALSIQDVEQAARRCTAFRDLLERDLRNSSSAAQAQGRGVVQLPPVVSERLSRVRSASRQLRENSASPSLLFELARAYFQGHSWRIAKGGVANLRYLESYLQDEPDLIEAALAGLEGVLSREDLPSAERTIREAARDRSFLLGLPLLASLELRAPKRSLSALARNRTLARSALALFYQRIPGGRPPRWYQHFLKSDPEEVSDLLTQYCRGFFRHRRVPLGVLSLLDHGNGHSAVASRTVVPLLRSFPLRCKREENLRLESLLVVALRIAEPAALQQLISQKLTRRSMTVAQRGRWLLAGLILDPAAFENPVRAFAREHPDRTAILAEFWGTRNRIGLHRGHQRVQLASVMIELFGAWVRPSTGLHGGFIGAEGKAEASVRALLVDLQDSPAPEAGSVLEGLADNPELEHWCSEVLRISEHRWALETDRFHKPPEPGQVVAALQNGPPANAADLLAVLSDLLDEVNHGLRSSNTNPWRQFWNEDSYGTPTSSKHEESCRDALVEELRPLLPDQVRIEPEPRWFNRKRPDFCIICREMCIPVEIKKHNRKSPPSLSRHLASLRDQLIGQYASHSPFQESAGFGVYLILWFGPSSGFEQPSALQHAISDRLPGNERYRILVYVLDVGAPESS